MTQLIRLRLDWYHGGYSAVSLTNERAESLNSVRREKHADRAGTDLGKFDKTTLGQAPGLR